MEKRQCPLCGGKIIKEEAFCRNCQQMANSSDANRFRKKELNISTAVNTPPTITEEVTDTSVQIEQPKNKALGIKKIDYVLIFLFIVMAGYTIYYFLDNENSEKEKAFWMISIDQNTSISYANYLQEYPNGMFSNTAAEKIRELKKLEFIEWNDLKISNDIDSFVAYILEYPNTPHLSQIKNKIDMIAWETALKENNVDAYRSYIENVDLGNYLGSFRDLAKERYNYHDQLEILEGKEREAIIAKMEYIIQSILIKDTIAIKDILDDNPISFFRIRALNRTELIDSLKVIYSRGDSKPVLLNIVKEETSVVKDIHNSYFISTSALEIKNGKQSTDTLSLELKLNKDFKIVRIEKK